ncbi:MAG: hypothetical protein ACFFBV_13915 [Promethearchaeota archaeon]
MVTCANEGGQLRVKLSTRSMVFLFLSIFAFDVFEHLPDYPRYIKLLSRVMKDGSEMYVIAPFGQNEPSHFRDIYDIDEICKKCNLIKKETLGKTIIYLKKS